MLDAVDAQGRLRFKQALMGRAKKNFKTADLVLAALYRLVGYDSPGGNQLYILANDLDQAADDLALRSRPSRPTRRCRAGARSRRGAGSIRARPALPGRSTRRS